MFHISVASQRASVPSHITFAPAHKRILSLVRTDSFAERWSELGGEAESLAIK